MKIGTNTASEMRGRYAFGPGGTCRFSLRFITIVWPSTVAHVVATGVDVAGERRKIEATYKANRGLRGLFAVDAGSTAGVAEVMRKYRLHDRGVRAGGYDLLPTTLRAIHDRDLDFTIDQQPYLQGFLPVLQLFLNRYSSGLVAPADTNTGLNFVTRANVGRYLTTRSRFEGSSSREQYPVG